MTHARLQPKVTKKIAVQAEWFSINWENDISPADWPCRVYRPTYRDCIALSWRLPIRIPLLHRYHGRPSLESPYIHVRQISPTTKIGRSYVQCNCCQSNRVWQRHRTRRHQCDSAAKLDFNWAPLFANGRYSQTIQYNITQHKPKMNCNNEHVTNRHGQRYKDKNSQHKTGQFNSDLKST